jgi:hypothetical protein
MNTEIEPVRKPATPMLPMTSALRSCAFWIATSEHLGGGLHDAVAHVVVERVGRLAGLVLLDQAFDRRQQFAGAARLREHQVGAGGLARVRGGLVLHRREDDDRQRGAALLGAEGLDDLEPVLVAQDEVGQDQIDVVADEGFVGVHDAGHGEDPVAGLVEVAGQHLGQGGGVVDEQDCVQGVSGLSVGSFIVRRPRST